MWLLSMANNGRQALVNDEMSKEKKLKIPILFVRVALGCQAVTVQLLRLSLNFTDRKPHRNKEREELCHCRSQLRLRHLPCSWF